MITETTRPIPVAVNLPGVVYSEIQKIHDRLDGTENCMKDVAGSLGRIDVCLRGIRGDACFHDMRESLHNISTSLEKIANKLHG
jgi:hypothetical protein